MAFDDDRQSPTESSQASLSKSREGTRTRDADISAPYAEMTAAHDVGRDLISGTIVAITPNSVVVSIGPGAEGLLPKADFINAAGGLSVSVGDEVEVERIRGVEGHVLLSYTKAAKNLAWSELEQCFREGRVIKGRVLDRIKGGLTIDVGVRAFLPGSLADIKPVKNLEALKGRELEFKVISLDRRRNNIVLSRKAVLEKEYEQKKAETLERLQEGVVLKGIVKSITDYGVFVDLGGIDGLLHIVDISWGRVNHPSEHFNVGDEVEVVVLRFARETERVSLGLKQLKGDPWAFVDAKYSVGERVHGTIIRVDHSGALLELEPGVEGHIHYSEISWGHELFKPSKILSVNQKIDAIVVAIDHPLRRLRLSLRQTERDPWEVLLDSRTDFGSLVIWQMRDARNRDLSKFRHPKADEGRLLQPRLIQIEARADSASDLARLFVAQLVSIPLSISPQERELDPFLLRLLLLSPSFDPTEIPADFHAKPGFACVSPEFLLPNEMEITGKDWPILLESCVQPIEIAEEG